MVYRLTWLATWLAGKTPRRLRLALAGPLTTLVYYLWPSKRRVTIANMVQILGTSAIDPRARRLARDSWRNYGRYLSDFFYLPNATSRQVVAWTRDVSGGPGAYGRIDQALARGKGLIIVTAHFGAFDVAGVYVAAHAPLAVIADTFTDPRLDALVQGQRAHFGLSVIRAEKSPRPILRHLKENGVVAIVADRPLARGEGTPVTFFGETCYVPSGIAQLALLSGAALAPGFAYYGEQGKDDAYIFRAYLAEPFFPEPTGDREADTIMLAQRAYSGMEEIIRLHPDQWYMFRPFWPEAPDTVARDTPARSPRAAPGTVIRG
jgi:KDO2-lipid IV(A) lauroyltransferase